MVKLTHIFESYRGPVEISADLSGIPYHKWDAEIKDFLDAIIFLRVEERKIKERLEASLKAIEPKEELSDYLSRTEGEDEISPVMVV